MLPQMTGYVKSFDSNKTMSFKVSDKKLLLWLLTSNDKRE